MTNKPAQNLIRKTSVVNFILSKVLLILIIPSFLAWAFFRLSAPFWMIFLFFVSVCSLVITFKTYRLLCFDDCLEKRYLFTRKKLTYPAASVNFKFPDNNGARYKSMPIIIAYSKQKLIGVFEFQSFDQIETFIIKTSQSGGGYHWFKPQSQSAVFDKIKSLIQKYSDGSWYSKTK